MRKTRFMCAANNVFTPDNDDTTNLKNIGWKDGVVSGASKYGIGSATLTTQIITATNKATYYRDLVVTMEIDSVTSGKEIGQATYRWRTNYTTPGAWEASGISTSTYLTPCQGVRATFSGGTGNDFELGDYWVFSYYCVYGIPRLNDQRRDTNFEFSYRTGGDDIIFWIDAGSTVSVNCCALLDVMMTGTASALSLVIGATATSGTLPLLWTETLSASDINTQSPHKAKYFATKTGRYFLFRLTFGSRSADFSFRLGQIFLGTYEETFPPEYGSGISQAMTSDGTAALSLEWNMLSDAEVTTLRNIYAASVNGMTYFQPIFLHLFDDVADSLYWVKPAGELQHSFRALNVNTISLEFEEVAANYVI